MNDYQIEEERIRKQYRSGILTATQYFQKLDQLLQKIIDDIDSQTITPLEIPAIRPTQA